MYKFKLNDGRMFTLDFKLLATDTIVEIKGYWTDKCREKWQLFCAEYPDIDKNAYETRFTSIEDNIKET